MPEAMTIGAPSCALRRRISLATQQGVDLRRRVGGFAETVADLLTDFDAETDAFDDARFDVAVESLRDLYACIETMASDIARLTRALTGAS